MYFDIAMPSALFVVVMVAVFLERRVEKKLKVAFEEREFGFRETFLLVAAMSVAVSLMVFIPQTAILLVFLFAYSSLLFIFTFLFSDFGKNGARIFCSVFLVISFCAGTLSLLSFTEDWNVVYGSIAFYCLFGFTLLALMYESVRSREGVRLYLAVLPSALFICLYVFFSRTPVWFPYLFNLYGAVFAVLMIIYLGSLFTWKTAIVFAGLLTIMDVILVLVTGSMVSAATHVSSLRLPILLSLPTIPVVTTSVGTLYISLGLGDFFFAGLLATQTSKEFGENAGVFSAAAISISFFVFEIWMVNYEIRAFPGTLMIICGWILSLVWRKMRHREVLVSAETSETPFNPA